MYQNPFDTIPTSFWVCWGLIFLLIIWTYNMLSKSFGKDEAFTVGLVLLSFIFLPILAFSNAQYIGPYGDKTQFNSHNLKNYEFGKE